MTPKRARLFVTFHPIGYSTAALDDLRRAADDVERGTALLERLAEAGWEVEFEGVDDGIAEFAALREFESPLAALDAAAALGAEGRMFEWPGLIDYVCVNEWDRDWICDKFAVGRSVHDDQLSMF
jgi:hypothetical protein